jgi:lysophospholipid hydrolase
MTLVGLLPPLSDEGNMLVDGGYTDNLPVSTMLGLGAASVFAVDVGSIDDTSPREFGESVSGWWVLINRWNPWSATRYVPTITEIQSRLTYVSSVKTLEEAKNTPGVLYMRMPVEQYGTMHFNKFTEIMETGYKASQKMLVDWNKQGKIPTGMVEDDGKAKQARTGRPGAGRPIRRNSI